MKIKEVIVVEGKKDSARMKEFFDVDTFETRGTGLSKADLAYLKVLHEKRGLILLTDPDYPGEYIRRKIMEEIPNVKQAFITAKQAREKGKVGVEHASKEVLEEALNHVVCFQEGEETLSYIDYLDLGLSGCERSKELRKMVTEYYHITKSNGKTLWKRLNALQLKKEEIQKVLK